MLYSIFATKPRKIIKDTGTVLPGFGMGAWITGRKDSGASRAARGETVWGNTILVAALWLLRRQNLFLIVPAGGAVYLAALIGLRAIDHEE